MRKYLIALLGAAALLSTAPLSAQAGISESDLDGSNEFDAAARADLAGPVSGIVAGIMFEGEMDLLAAWGTPTPGSGESMNPQYLFPWPAFGEMILGVTVRALHDAGQIDAFQPLGQIIPGLRPMYQRMTLDQLLTHRAGFDDAPADADLTWDSLLEDLPDAAVMAPPGTVFSWSRYSYPVLGRILETLLGAPVADIAQFAVISPLGMSRTSFDRDFAEAGGLASGMPDASVRAEPWALPTAYTTTPDALQFMAAWMGGAIRGAEPGRWAPEFNLAGRTFVDGLWMEEIASIGRFTRSGSDLGFSTSLELHPHAVTATLFWGNGVGARRLQQVADREVAFGLGTLGMDIEAGTPGAMMNASWAGTYLNGDQIVVIETDAQGLVYFDGASRAPLQRTEDGSYLAMNGAGGQLTLMPREIGAEKAIYIGPRAYLRTDENVRRD